MTHRWLELAQTFDAENLSNIEPNEIISDNGISIVYNHQNMIFKRSIPFLIENEFYFLNRMRERADDEINPYGFVPFVKRVDKYTIQLENIKNEPVTDKEYFMSWKDKLYQHLQSCGIRHGDITTANILVRDNQPFLIDWAESRFINTLIPDKRSEGDFHWLEKTWNMLTSHL